ncbi:DUF3016 domain-containing protein [Thiolapillus sp.]
MKVFSLLVFSILLIPATATAGGSAVIHWSSPGGYKDIKASIGTQEQFQKQTFAELEAYMQKLAASLPNGQKLEMTVTNLDLAGYLRTSDVIRGYSDIRVVKDMYPAKIQFQYRLLDSNGKLLKEGSENLKSMPPGSTASMRFNANPLSIEKRMLKKWFMRTIKQGD